MRKIILGLYVFILIMAVGFVWNKSSYFAYIDEEGKVTNQTLDNGKALTSYNYEVSGYDTKGEKKELVVKTNHNLRQETYLKIVTNKDNDIIKWKEIDKKKIPRQSLQNIVE
ncbi:YxeA family protein [Lactococcus garvieae]|uniref:YxeA family protein n=1 Tax=Lactococcus garvieae TaxID=1363 RepID=A0AA46TWM4_9LACT|nr:YxeA family protein [Lactococcus garvieae]UYT10743.1 YxeA family protein [Lactococcus garvieae]UYT12785.1 YxeA family protein [Lactococcus garvieae]